MALVRTTKTLGLKAIKSVARAGAMLRACPDGLLPPTTRASYLATIEGEQSILEIGPFNCPQFQGDNVSYFDVLDQNGLKQRAAEHNRPPHECPAIDFVSHNGDLDIVDRSFHTVFSSHALEHQPDILSHLLAIQRILEPGGHLAMIVPDKRFCFDYFIAESTLADVLQASILKERTHTARSILLHRLFTTHNHPMAHWLGFHGDKPQPHRDIAALDAARAEYQGSALGRYVDVHGWFFTPHGFLNIVRGLRTMGLIDLVPISVHQTAFFDQEFFVTMQAPGAT